MTGRRKYDVLCFGEACCDVIFGGLEKLPPIGQEEYCKKFVVKAGGASNTAMALSVMGRKTGFATCIGEDEFSKIVKKFAEKYKVSFNPAHFDKNYEMAVSAVISTVKDRSFATYAGSGIDNYPLKKLEESILSAGHIHTYVGYALNYPVMEYAKKSRATVSLDTSWWPGIKLKDLEHILKDCVFFKPNEMEAYELCDTDDPYKALDILAQVTPVPVISLGGKGALMKMDNKTYEYKIPGKTIVTDTTGAGDLFFAGLIHSYLKGDTPSMMLKFACTCGTAATAFYGGMDDMFADIIGEV